MNIEDFLRDRASDQMELAKEDLENMELGDKMQLAASLNLKGVSKKSIAEYFGISVRQLYNWLNKTREAFLEELETKTGIDLIVENLSDIEDFQRLCMYEASHLGADQIEIDPLSGVRRVKKSETRNLADKSRFLKLALDAMKMKVDILNSTGLIPNQAERIYSVVGDNKVDTEEVDENNMPVEELSNAVLDKLRRQLNL